MNLVDTHCHIHFPDYELDPDEVIKSAEEADVKKMICVGCTLTDSRIAIEFANKYKNIWSSIGLHPHEAKEYVNDDHLLQQFRNLLPNNRVVAVGECGLDYHYMHSSKADQIKMFRYQLDLGIEFNLPFIFHVREAFADFWEIIDEYIAEGAKLRGVVHSFSTSDKELEQVLSRGFYVGLNGIMTFTSDNSQLLAAKSVPTDRMLLETDAPFLTPTPFRGTMCEPKHVRTTAEFLAHLRGETVEALAIATSANAHKLFGLKE